MSDFVVPFDHASFSSFLSDSWNPWHLQDVTAVNSFNSRHSRQGDPIANKPIRPAVIAYRKACEPNGVGLSHYVLMTGKRPAQASGLHPWS